MQDSDVIESPFKFLRPYDKDDHEIFFGRDDAAKELYQYVNKNRLVIIYGPPDCGKTSLVQCGLASWFDATEWAPFFIRRSGNINHSLFRTLNNSEVLMQNVLPADVSPEKIVDALALIEKRCLRPVYLLFDQFEETLVRGSDDEIKTFISILQRILSSGITQSCHLVFILRGGHLDRLRPFEKAIPGFSERKIPVQPLLEPEIAAIIRHSCKHFNITFSKPEEQVDLIMHALAGQPDLTLSYLQVYMDRLWRDDFARTYPEGYTGEQDYPPLEFTSAEIESLGNIRKVILHFLIERTGVIQEGINEKFPSAGKDTVKSIIDAFVSAQGLELSIGYTEASEAFQLPATAPRYLRELPPDLFSIVVRKLEANRIIRLNGYSMELSNNLLAELIYYGRPRERKRRDEIERIIIGQYEAFPATRQYLTDRQVRIYEAFLPQLNLEEKHLAFFRRSKKRRQIYGTLKVLGFLVLPLIGFLLFGIFRFAYEADKSYALYYLNGTVDTIKNKPHAIRLAKDIYDKKRKTGYSDVIRQTFLGLFQSQPIQEIFSDSTYFLATTSVNPEDIDISGNGDFVLVADTSSSSPRYKLFSRNGVLDTTFKGLKDSTELKYAYFINHTDSILLAYKRNLKDTLFFPQFKDYPDYFRIFNCRKPEDTMQTFFIGDGFLLPKATVSYKPKSDYDSYKIRFTDSGYLLVPFFARNEKNSINLKLRIYWGIKMVNPNKKSSSSISISKDGKRICIGYFKGKIPVAEFYNEAGKPLGSISDIYFADFTARGSVIYIRKGAVVFNSADGDTGRRYYVSPEINYAWADGADEKFILTHSNDSVFLINTSGDVMIDRFAGKLLGANFADQFFITLQENGTETGKSKGVTLQRRLFTGNARQHLFISSGVRDFQFNDHTQELLVLTDSNRLLLLDKYLKVKASFQLTANDLFGFCKNGSRLYYVRDNWLSVFSNDGQLIDLSNFQAVYTWLERKEKESKKSRHNTDSSFSKRINELRKLYKLSWPSQNFF